jgi:hypothetical protein
MLMRINFFHPALCLTASSEGRKAKNLALGPLFY